MRPNGLPLAARAVAGRIIRRRIQGNRIKNVLVMVIGVNGKIAVRGIGKRGIGSGTGRGRLCRPVVGTGKGKKKEEKEQALHATDEAISLPAAG